jgi:hypothetical protein
MVMSGGDSTIPGHNPLSIKAYITGITPATVENPQLFVLYDTFFFCSSAVYFLHILIP